MVETGLGFPSSGHLKANILNSQREQLFEQAQKSSLASAQAESIFSQQDIAFSEADHNYTNLVLEKSASQLAYNNVEQDFKNLKSQETMLDLNQSITTKNFIAHETVLKQENDEIASIEKQIASNHEKIAKHLKTNNGKVQFGLLQGRKSFLQNEVSGLKGIESGLKFEVTNIKDQIQNIKSGNFSIANLQESITGSSNSQSIDTSKIMSNNSSVNAMIGEKQNSMFIEKFEARQAQMMNKKAKETHEEVKAQVKKQLLSVLEQTLETKQQQLKNTKTNINQKQNELNKSEESAASQPKGEESPAVEIEELLMKNEELVQKRYEKDAGLQNYEKVNYFFNRIVRGGVNGIQPKLERKEELLVKKEKQLINANTLANESAVDFNIKNMKKESAKSSYLLAKASADVDQKMYDDFNQKYS